MTHWWSRWCRCAQVACVCGVVAGIAGVVADARHLKVSKLGPMPGVTVSGTGALTTTSAQAAATVTFSVATGKDAPTAPAREQALRRSGQAERPAWDAAVSRQPPSRGS